MRMGRSAAKQATLLAKQPDSEIIHRCLNCQATSSTETDKKWTGLFKFQERSTSTRSSSDKGRVNPDPTELKITLLQALDLVFQITEQKLPAGLPKYCSLCTECEDILAPLVQLYLQFVSASKAGSFIRNLLRETGAVKRNLMQYWKNGEVESESELSALSGALDLPANKNYKTQRPIMSTRPSGSKGLPLPPTIKRMNRRLKSIECDSNDETRKFRCPQPYCDQQWAHKINSCRAAKSCQNRDDLICHVHLHQLVLKTTTHNEGEGNLSDPVDDTTNADTPDTEKVIQDPSGTGTEEITLYDLELSSHHGEELSLVEDGELEYENEIVIDSVPSNGDSEDNVPDPLAPTRPTTPENIDGDVNPCHNAKNEPVVVSVISASKSDKVHRIRSKPKSHLSAEIPGRIIGPEPGRKELHMCEFCGYKTKLQANLNQHRRAVHSVGETKYTCDVCGKKCGSKYLLNRHAVGHTGERLFMCDRCPNTYKYKTNLHEHQMLHAGKKFSCDICGVQVRHKGHLTRHIQNIHHGVKRKDRKIKKKMCVEILS